MSDLNAVLSQIDTDQDAALERLFELLRIESISTDPAYKEACKDASDLLVADLNSIGFKAERIRARGAADDKGQLMTFVEACRSYSVVDGKLPARITIFFEGEEESGSPSLVPFLEENRDELTATFIPACMAVLRSIRSGF